MHDRRGVPRVQVRGEPPLRAEGVEEAHERRGAELARLDVLPQEFLAL